MEKYKRRNDKIYKLDWKEKIVNGRESVGYVWKETKNIPTTAQFEFDMKDFPLENEDGTREEK